MATCTKYSFSPYAHGIIKNHPFVDGNKRTGMAVALIFLQVNDYEITLSDDHAYDIAIDLATSEISYDVVAKIFKDYCIKKKH